MSHRINAKPDVGVAFLSQQQNAEYINLLLSDVEMGRPISISHTRNRRGSLGYCFSDAFEEGQNSMRCVER